MKSGIYLDPRSWKIDLTASPFWNPEKYGVKIDLHPNAFNIPKTGIDSKYTFVIASEVWEILMHKALDYLRKQGLKVFLLAREPIKYGELKDAMFSYERFKFNGKYYFKPDVVCAAGAQYEGLWKDKTKTCITGYPRWDWYIGANKRISKSAMREKYGLQNKKIIFFPSYPPYHYKKVGGKDTMIDLFDAREKTLQAVSEFAKANKEYQFVTKIHPMSMKCYRKKIGVGNEVSGLLEKYYKTPTEYFKVIGDDRMSGDISKELIVVSDLVVGYNSTMLLESTILDKPVIQVLIGDSAGISSPYDGVFEIARTKESLLSLLVEANESFNKFISPKAKDLSKGYIGDVDGGSCERICNVIKKNI